MKIKTLFVIILFSFSLCYPLQAKAQLGSHVATEVKYIFSTEMIPMRDGVKLATDIYLPNYIGESKRGVILIRTPYDKSGASSFATLFTSVQGYITVIQDMRGRFASEGIDMVFLNASTDGYDTIKWIMDQSWCNGKIGTYGMSALGITQFFMNLAHPEGLTAQAIQIASPDLYYDIMFPGGAFQESLVIGWLESIGSSFWLPTIYENENYNTIWNNVTMKDKYLEVAVPGIFQAGWFDVFSQGTINGFLGYQYESNPSNRGKSFLVIGPWGHGTYFDQTQGEITFPKNAIKENYIPLMNDFFSYYLKDDANAIYTKKAVQYYCMGPTYDGSIGNFWREADQWPIPVEYTNFYLHGDNTLALTESISGFDAQYYYYDPNNPIPTIGGNNLNLPFGPYDQSSLESRNDILIFTSEPLDNYLEVTGRMSAHLWVSSNCTDTDFTVKITDVYPDGTSMLIQDGIVRAKYSNNRTSPELLTPNEIFEIDIDLCSTSYIFNPRHKIRVAISSSNYPRFNANLNNGLPLFSNNQTFIANNTLYHDMSHPSYITLPININGTLPIITTTTSVVPAVHLLEIISIQIIIATYYTIYKIVKKRKL